MVSEQKTAISELRQVRLDKLDELRGLGIDPFGSKYERDTQCRAIHTGFDQLEGQKVKIAGRITAKRRHGKAGFADLADLSGSIQLYFRKEDVGEERYELFKSLDVGDILGVTGRVFRTQKGEISVHVSDFTYLSKSLNPLPEKWHGLKDVDLRYRQRYVDLIMNPDVKEVFVKRSRIVQGMRNYLNDRGFLEVETPMMHPIAGGATARPFITHHNTLDCDLYLRIAPELYLKRLIVGGLERVYEINRSFRNEGIDTRHNPEFTMLELYQAYADFTDMMDILEDMLVTVLRDLNGGSLVLENEGVTLDFTPPWRRISMLEAVREYTGIDFSLLHTEGEVRAAVADLKLTADISKANRGEIVNQVFEDYVEDQLIQPTFIYGHPVEISPLARRNRDNPDYTDRFELFVNRNEVANAFSELNDPLDQKERFRKQMEKRAEGDGEAHMMDEDYINALEYGMPPAGGMGIGIDRVCMLFTDSSSIRDVILFPILKPIGSSKAAEPSEPAADAEDHNGFFTPNDKIDFSQVQVEPLFEDAVDFATFSKSDFRAVKVKECQAVPKSKKLLRFTLDDGTGQDRTILSGIRAFYEPEELLGKTLIAITNLPPRAMMGIDSSGMLLSAVHKEEGAEKLHLLMVDNHIPAGAKLY